MRSTRYVPQPVQQPVQQDAPPYLALPPFAETAPSASAIAEEQARAARVASSLAAVGHSRGWDGSTSTTTAAPAFQALLDVASAGAETGSRRSARVANTADGSAAVRAALTAGGGPGVVESASTIKTMGQFLDALQKTVVEDLLAVISTVEQRTHKTKVAMKRLAEAAEVEEALTPKANGSGAGGKAGPQGGAMGGEGASTHFNMHSEVIESAVTERKELGRISALESQVQELQQKLLAKEQANASMTLELFALRNAASLQSESHQAAVKAYKARHPNAVDSQTPLSFTPATRSPVRTPLHQSPAPPLM